MTEGLYAEPEDDGFLLDQRVIDHADPDTVLAPSITRQGLARDTRPHRTRLRDHERLRENGGMLAARLGDDQSVPPFAAMHYEGDCGYDLATTEDTVLRPGETADIPCGVAVALPPYTFGWITGRSSSWRTWGVQVMGGIIDEGWRGELFTLVFRPITYPETRDVNLLIPAGTRLSQLIIMPNLAPQVRMYRVEPDDLPRSDRGTNGFGSTG
jgi:dUTP pyrophosphatase